MTVEIGQQLRFTGEPHPETGALRHLGQDGEAHSLAGAPDGNHALPIGSIGTVEVFVPAEVDGAGTHEDDCWVLSFPTKSAYVDANGNAALLVSTRNISFEADQLDAWFAPVTENDVALASVQGDVEQAAQAAASNGGQ